MNPKQENIAKKIKLVSDKNKNNKNNRHGPYDDEVRTILIDELRIPQGYKEYNDMFNVLEELIRSGRYRRFNQWLRDQSIYTIESPTSLLGRFYRYCYALTQEKNKNVTFDEDTCQIVKIKNEEEKIPITGNSPGDFVSTDKVPINPTEIEQKEISKLKNEVGKLQKIKETSDDIDEKKEKHEKSLKELSDAMEENENKQREELEKKLEKKKKKTTIPKPTIEEKVEEITEPIDSTSRSALTASKMPPTPSPPMPSPKPSTTTHTSKSTPGRSSSREALTASKMPSPIHKSKLSIEEISEKINEARGCHFQGNITKDLFISTFNKIVNDGKYSKLSKEIIDRFSKTPKALIDPIKDVSRMMINNKLISATGGSTFKDNWDNFIKMDLNNFKKGDKLPITESVLKDKLKQLIKIHYKPVTKKESNIARDEINKIINPYGFNIRGIYNNGNKIDMNPYSAYRVLMRNKEKGAIDTNPDNAKDFFPFDIHKIYNIIENGLKKKLTDSLKNDIEAIIDQETRNMRYHTNISHGTNTIQNVIVEIENYINEKKIDKSKIFKFSEQNRYRLKQLLSKFLNQ